MLMKHKIFKFLKLFVAVCLIIPCCFGLSACKNNTPIIPCFITMEDSKEHIDGDGLPVQEYTVHIMKPIYKDENLPFKEAVQKMKNQNFEMCKEIYEKTYGIPLTYSN